MKQVHASASEDEAQNLRQFLIASGIEATVIRDLTTPHPDSEPDRSPTWTVVVHDDDYENACSLVEQFQQQSLQSTTSVEDASPSVTFPRRDGWLWLQLLIVLALTQPYYSPVYTMLWRNVLHWSKPSFAQQWVLEVGHYLLSVFIVLFIVRLSGERWSTYGLKPRNLSVDFITGCLAFICGIFAAIIGTDLFETLLTDLQGKPYLEPHHFRYWMDAPRNPIGLLAVLGLAIVIALGEELVARGYLIPTLERLLKSTPSSVLLAAVYFGVCHAHLGVLHVWYTFLIGVVFGIFFVLTRRLWPLVFAHALIDFSIFIHPPR